MRLWSIHPKYLDARGLVALWREALLAQAVLRHRTTGYVHHPQLLRFRAQPSPLGAIADYLRDVHAESARRGYTFAARKISPARGSGVIALTRGQLMYEWRHLIAKLALRDPERRREYAGVARPQPHPSFRVVPGDVAPWEKQPHMTRTPMNSDTAKYNKSLGAPERKICDLLGQEIARKLPEAENKIWHAHPVWFLDGNPVVGYSTLKGGVRLLFWSGQSFEEEGLVAEGSFEAAEARFTAADQIRVRTLRRWLTKARDIQWDYKNIVKRKGRLARVK